MKCIHCGGQLKSARENHLYDAQGVRVTLIGVNVKRCGACGESFVGIPKVEELHRVIVYAISTKSARLTPEEIRFLRKSLGWSGTDFARHFGVERETVSRWESGSQKMNSTADRLLRLAATTFDPIQQYPIDRLQEIEEEAIPLRLGFRSAKKGWVVEEDFAA